MGMVDRNWTKSGGRPSPMARVFVSGWAYPSPTLPGKMTFRVAISTETDPQGTGRVDIVGLNPPLQIELPLEGVCIYPGNTRSRNFCKFCRTFIPVPGASGSSVRPCHKTRNFWQFCKTFIPVPELLLVVWEIHTRTRNFCEFCTPRATIPGVLLRHLSYPPGTSVSSVRSCHNTQNFWKFFNTFIPVPETPGS